MEQDLTSVEFDNSWTNKQAMKKRSLRKEGDVSAAAGGDGSCGGGRTSQTARQPAFVNSRPAVPQEPLRTPTSLPLGIRVVRSGR